MKVLPDQVGRVSIEPNGAARIALRRGSPRPRTGKPFVVPVSAVAPSGALGIVTAVFEKAGGRLVVKTRPAALDEVYSQLRIALRGATIGELEADGGATSSAAPLFSCTGSGPAARFDVRADFSKLKPDFLIDVGRPEIYFMLSGSPKLSIDLASEASASCRYNGNARIVIPVAGTPVAITIKPAIKGSLSGKVGAGFTWSPRVAVGVQSGPGVNQSFHTFSKGSVSAPSFSGSAQANAFLGVSVGVSVAERVGIEGTAGPQLAARVGSSGSSTCLDASGSLRADLNAYADVFVKRWSFSIAKGEFGKTQILRACGGQAGGGGPTGSGPGPGPGSPFAGAFKSVSAGGKHTCGIRSDDTIACWGVNDFGQSTPPPGAFKSVSAGSGHTCALRSDDTIACWGSDRDGQATPPPGAFKSVSAGSGHTCGVRGDDTVACWGVNGYGQATPPPGPFKSVSAGSWHTCAIRDNASVVCWGRNLENQTTSPSGTFRSVSAGYSHTCAIRSDDLVACWGG